jgi:hypothetical protein
MVAVMFAQFVLAPPEVSHAGIKAVSATAVSSAQDARLWWHASGWAAWSGDFCAASPGDFCDCFSFTRRDIKLWRSFERHLSLLTIDLGRFRY